MSRMRLFAALEVPEAIKYEINAWWQLAYPRLGPDLWRAVLPHQWHMTLAFYGDVSGRDADDLAEMLAVCADASPRLHLCLTGCGIFPQASRPRTFWAGVESLSADPALKHLARCCRRAGHVTVRNRTAREAPFRAHITLARANGHLPALLDLQALPPVPELNWQADHLCLFQSILHADGAQYRQLERFECRGAQRIPG
ncbi:2'-5' RNA ligase [Mariprofundus ferrooxydans]|uniref:RNA 2',3'-cyclic phosphodiesterase n=2 Tax=Mariprofundus ferrooxydans TaxID=314344 RepID=Q0F3T5_9PROT|nr:2`-5` RNA ligase, putative [Mariprofundus ferrooxydans PV-1]KON48139.1 2'-5' RNA ligase [Mariprofundus ferrooxydans]